MIRSLILSLAVLLPTTQVFAQPPEIVAATATKSGMGWRIEVTLKHPDTGWDHFASGWEVRDESGTLLGFRKLHHPHVNEQPFSRSLPSVMIPDGIRRVVIRAFCSHDDEVSAPFEMTLVP